MRRALSILLAVAIALPLAALAAGQWYLGGDAVRARLQEAVRRATGRELTIAGPLHLSWSLTPTIEADEVSLSNPPGMSRPEMARAKRLQAQFALLPLLSRRVELRHVLLVAPDILLERDGAGRPNWVMTPPAPAAPSAPVAPSAPSAAGPQFEFELGAVEVRDGRIAWRGASTVEVRAPRLAYTPGDGRIDGNLTVNGVPFALTGTAGPVAGAAWPVGLRLSGAGIVATLSGTSQQAGLAVEAADLSAASALGLQGLPALRNVALAATLSPAGLSGIQLRAGPSPFGNARVEQLALTAPRLDGPADLRASVVAGSLPVAVTAHVESLAALAGPGKVPLSFRLATDGALVEGKGTAEGRTAALALSGHVIDLARSGALAGLTLPALQNITLATQLTLNPAGLELRGLKMTSAQGDLSGDLAIAVQPRPSIRGALSSQRLDLRALGPVPVPASGAGAAGRPAPPPRPPRGGRPPPPPDRVIPDAKLPFGLLRQADADVGLTIAEAVWHGVSYRALQARALLAGGTLRLDPVSVETGGVVKGTLLADAAAQTVSLRAQGSGLAAGAALAAFGVPADTKGTLDLDVELAGKGDTLRSVAGTLSGRLGVALVDGEVANRWLEDLLAEALRAASIPLEAGGTSRIRCAAVRADAAAGQVKIVALALDTSKLKLDGTGQIDLGREALDLHLLPQLRLGAALSVPVRVSGTLRAPKVALDPGAIAPGRVGIIIGGAPAQDTCGPALALARNGKAGAPPPPMAPATGGPLKPADLLRGLFR